MKKYAEVLLYIDEKRRRPIELKTATDCFPLPRTEELSRVQQNWVTIDKREGEP